MLSNVLVDHYRHRTEFITSQEEMRAFNANAIALVGGMLLERVEGGKLPFGAAVLRSTVALLLATLGAMDGVRGLLLDRPARLLLADRVVDLLTALREVLPLDATAATRLPRPARLGLSGALVDTFADVVRRSDAGEGGSGSDDDEASDCGDSGSGTGDDEASSCGDSGSTSSGTATSQASGDGSNFDVYSVADEERSDGGTDSPFEGRPVTPWRVAMATVSR